jgi:hypothetical protein
MWQALDRFPNSKLHRAVYDVYRTWLPQKQLQLFNI